MIQRVRVSVSLRRHGFFTASIDLPCWNEEKALLQCSLTTKINSQKTSMSMEARIILLSPTSDEMVSTQVDMLAGRIPGRSILVLSSTCCYPLFSEFGIVIR